MWLCSCCCCCRCFTCRWHCCRSWTSFRSFATSNSTKPSGSLPDKVGITIVSSDSNAGLSTGPPVDTASPSVLTSCDVCNRLLSEMSSDFRDDECGFRSINPDKSPLFRVKPSRSAWKPSRPLRIFLARFLKKKVIKWGKQSNISVNMILVIVIVVSIINSLLLLRKWVYKWPCLQYEVTGDW